MQAYLVGSAAGDYGAVLLPFACQSHSPPPHQHHRGGLMSASRWSIGQCERLQVPAVQSHPVRHNPACWPAAPFSAHPNRIIRDLHHRKLLDEPSPIDRNHHLRHDPSQSKPILTVTGTPSRSHGVQNCYPRFLHHSPPAAKRARPEAGDQAKPRAYGALRTGCRGSQGDGDAGVHPPCRLSNSPRAGHELMRSTLQILGAVMVAAFGGAGLYFGTS